MAPKYFENVGLTADQDDLTVEELVQASLLVGNSIHDILPAHYKDMRKTGKKVSLKLELDENEMGFVTASLSFDIRSL